jgi:uncharacterized membrane protein
LTVVVSKETVKRRPEIVGRIASLFLVMGLVLLPAIIRLDGKPHADWQQFLGRFHPLAVHIPIGLILLVPLLEIAGRSRPALRDAASFVLSLSLLSCIAALILGYLLAFGSGEVGAAVTRHMWGGIALTVGVLLCIWSRSWWASGAASGSMRRIYPVSLVCILLLLAWTAHQGGSLTHGANYLFEFLPTPLKRIAVFGASAEKEQLVADSFYAKHIHPMLDANCVGCHGESKSNGHLRLDTLASLMRGGDEGPAVIAGQPDKSPLLQRITLPSDHKKFMPAEGKPPLKPEQIAWLRAWIEQGASPNTASLKGIVVREEFTEPPLEQVGDYSSQLSAMHQLAMAAGVMLTPVSRKPGDGLILNTENVASRFGDAQLVKFVGLAPYIVEIDLSRTAVTDTSCDTLAKFTHLRALHLEGTAITGTALAKLAPLSHLTYLNLSETKVTQSTLAPLRSMKNLHRLYTYDTPAQPLSSAETEASSIKKAP